MAKLLSICAIAVLAIAAAPEPPVTFLSPTQCDGEHAVYRWAVKTDHEAPPDAIAESNKVKPSDIGGWPEPRGKIGTLTPRSGREKEWFQLTGKVTLLKAEPDGDLHIQLVDVDGSSQVNVVVEIPVKQAPGESPWSDLRTTVFGWTNRTFPFTTTSGEKLNLMKTPVIRVEGKAFFDGQHRSSTPNRRGDEPNKEVTVWEIHPVMILDVIADQ
jgi:hypothetical protein